MRAELRAAALFRDTDLDRLWSFIESAPVRDLDQGQVLMAEGEVERSVFVLLEGKVSVYVGSPHLHKVATLSAGSTVGELAIIDHRPRSATVIAATRCRALEISEETFWVLLRSSHTFALNVLGTLCDRLRGLNVTLSESRRLEQLYEQEARIDALTGIGNRRWLDDVLPRQIERNRANGEALSVIMIDVDYFKRINDTYGHAVGDHVLFKLAQLFKARFRPTDLVGRYGGEEFTVILPGTGRSGGVRAAERVRQVVAETAFALPDREALPSITISLGVSEMTAGVSPDELLRRADQALYAAKREGRNRTVAG